MTHFHFWVNYPFKVLVAEKPHFEQRFYFLMRYPFKNHFGFQSLNIMLEYTSIYVCQCCSLDTWWGLWLASLSSGCWHKAVKSRKDKMFVVNAVCFLCVCVFQCDHYRRGIISGSVCKSLCEEKTLSLQRCLSTSPTHQVNSQKHTDNWFAPKNVIFKW